MEKPYSSPHGALRRDNHTHNHNRRAMKTTVNRSILADALKSVSGLARPSVLPAPSSILLRAGEDCTLTACASDGDIYATVTMGAAVAEPGDALIPAKRLLGIVRETDGEEIAISSGGAEASITCGSSSFRIASLPAKDFPSPDGDAKRLGASVDVADLRRAIRGTAYAAAPENAGRPILSTVLLQFAPGKMTAVATDGKRLSSVAVKSDNADDTFSITASRRAASVLVSSLPDEGAVSVEFCGSTAVFACGGVEIRLRLVDGVYPNWRQVCNLPEGTTDIPLPREDMLSVLRRVMLMATDNSMYVKVEIGGNAIVATSSSATIGEARDSIPAKYDGSPVVFTVNPAFLTEVLSGSDADTLLLRFSTGSRPLFLTDEGGGLLSVVMPLR